MPSISRGSSLWVLQLQKKIEEKEHCKDNESRKFTKLEKLVNSELASKIQKSIIEHNEFLIEINGLI